MKIKMFKFIGKADELVQAIQDEIAEQQAKKLEKVILENKGKIGKIILEEMINAENGEMFMLEEKDVDGGVELTMARIIKVVSK